MGKGKNTPIDVVLAIPNRAETVPTEVALAWTQLINFTKTAKPHVTIRFAANSVYYIDEARWELVRLACERGADYVFFVDADMLIPEHALVALLDLDVDFATGLGFTNDKDRPIPSWYLYIPEHERRNHEVGKTNERRCWAPLLFYHNAPPNIKAFQLDGCGLYAALIKTDVFHRIAQSHDSLIEWYNPFKRNGAGEDLSFCYRTRDLGIKVVGRRDVVCDHISRKRQLINEELYLQQFSPEKYDCYWIGETTAPKEEQHGADFPSVSPALSRLA